MKRNFFGKLILQKDDDVGAAFVEAFETDVAADLIAQFIDDDFNFGWSCVISDDDGNELQAQDFASEEELRQWLHDKNIRAM